MQSANPMAEVLACLVIAGGSLLVLAEAITPWYAGSCKLSQTS